MGGTGLMGEVVTVTGSTVNVFVLLTDEARTRFSRIQSRLIIISKCKKYHIFKSA